MTLRNHTMRDLLSKLDAIVTETALKDKDDLATKRQALDDLESDPVAGKDPEISAAIEQRRSDLEKEANAKGFTEGGIDFDKIRADASDHLKKSIDKQSDDRIAKLKADREKEDEPFMAQVGRKIIGGVKGGIKGAARGFAGKESIDEGLFQIGDAFGISFSEDHEIATEIVDILEDGIVIELDDTALDMLTNEGLIFLDGEIVREEKQKGVDGKACWKGYKRMGTKMKGGKRVDNCVKMGEDLEESGLQYYTGKKKYGKDGMAALAQAGRNGASEEEHGRIKDKYKKEDTGIEEGRMAEIAAELSQIADDEDYDKLYDLLSDDGPVGAYLQDKIQDITGETGLHPKDDIEKIEMMLMDIVQQEFGGQSDDEGGETDDNYALASAGFGSDEDYGDYGNNESQEERTHKGGTVIRTDKGLKHYAKYDDDKEDDQDNDKINKGMIYSIEKSTKPDDDVDEAKYQGREVPLGKKMAGDVKKSKVYVRKPNGKIVKVNFGDKKMRIKKSNPARRKSFRARHNCKNPGPRWKARYWSCRSW